MPKRIKFDSEKILESFKETGSRQETAKLLGIHENTVYAALKRSDSKCISCGNPVASNRKYCNSHLKHFRERARKKRHDKQMLGICGECDERIEKPSNLYCDTHREAHRKHRENYVIALTKRDPPTIKNKERRIRTRYGEAGIAVWRKAKDSCLICGVGHEESRIVMHHLDKIPTNNTEENLVCLCHKCHQLTHLLSEHTDPTKIVQWICTTYNLTPPDAD